MIVKVFTDVDVAWSWINSFFLQSYADYIGKNFLVLFESVSIPDKYFILAAFINRFDEDENDYISTVLPGVGVNDNIKFSGGAAVKEQQRLTLNDPFDAPYFNDYIDNSFTSSLNDIGVNTLSPIFQFAITGSSDGSTLDPGNETIFKTYFGTGGSAIKSNHIHSTLFPADASNIGYYVVGGNVDGTLFRPRGLLIAPPDANSSMGKYNVPGISSSPFYLTIETQNGGTILDSENLNVTQ